MEESFDNSSHLDENEGRNMEEEYARGIRSTEALGLIDIGSHASWTLSSFKQGCGVEALRQDTPETYWQSDGLQPHTLDIHFSKRVSINRLSIFVDLDKDESYTPWKIVIYAGTGFHDLMEVTTVTMESPSGWTDVTFEDNRADHVLKAYLIRLSIVANHQSGKDTHLRAVKVYSPIGSTSLEIAAGTSVTLPRQSDVKTPKSFKTIPFNSIKMLSEMSIR